MKVIIVGGGQVGNYLASLLIDRGHDVRVIEIKDSRIDVLKRSIDPSAVIHGSGSDPQLLESLDIQHTDVLAAVTGTDECNLVIATMARLEYGVKRVVARVNNPKNAWLFNAVMGVDAAVNQADLLAKLVVEEMSMGEVIVLSQLDGGHHLIVERRLTASSKHVGHTLADLNIDFACSLVAIIRQGRLLIPSSETTLLADDKLIAITEDVDLQKFDDLLKG